MRAAWSRCIVENALRADGHCGADALATLLLAAFRGLLLDLDVTGDIERTAAAAHALAGLLMAATSPGRGAPSSTGAPG